jgi:two-component system cell cycle response regulator
VKVLIAHADAAVRHHLRGILEGLGYEVTEAADVGELDAQCERAAPDVTLLDAQLAPDAGVALITRIKSHPHAYFTSIVMIDRDLDLGDARVKLDSGAHDFLIEPVRPAEVAARVQAAARTRSLQEELLIQGRRLEALIFEDPLTQLYNRRFMLNQLTALVSGARRHKRPLSVVMIDVDHFKSLNDTYGHEVGDRVLLTVARAMRDRLRAEDYVGRLGGEEFLALLPDADAAAAAEVADALRETVADVVVRASDEEVRVTVSAGHATWDGESPEQLLRRADDAMYRAKAAGRDAVERG